MNRHASADIHPVAVLVPKQGRGGDVRNAPYPPLRAVEHLANQPTAPEGGEAA